MLTISLYIVRHRFAHTNMGQPNASSERLDGRSSSLSFLQNRLNRLSLARSRPNSKHPGNHSTEDRKGPLGLNLLHEPSEPRIDFIFVSHRYKFKHYLDNAPNYNSVNRCMASMEDRGRRGAIPRSRGCSGPRIGFQMNQDSST